MQSVRLFPSLMARLIASFTDRLGSKIWQPFVTLLILSATIVLLILTSTQRGVAIEFTPPDRNAPGRVIIDGGGARFSTDSLPDRGAPSQPIDGGGARFSDFDLLIEGTRSIISDDQECPVTAIIPATNAGLTLSPYPRFFFHMPPYPGASVAFRLETENGDLVYATQFVPEARDGTYEIALPTTSNLPPLAVGTMYHWTFEIPSENLTLSGGILRGEPSEEFAADLAAAQPIERVRLLAETGIWFDAMSEVADLVRSDRTNADYERLWDELLQSVDLQKIADRALL
jgi:Domain of Unknown Function (DUF928)